MNSGAKLICLCGKMAAGKSTLARDLAEREDAMLLVQDEFVETREERHAHRESPRS